MQKNTDLEEKKKKKKRKKQKKILYCCAPINHCIGKKRKNKIIYIYIPTILVAKKYIHILKEKRGEKGCVFTISYSIIYQPHYFWGPIYLQKKGKH